MSHHYESGFSVHEAMWHAPKTGTKTLDYGAITKDIPAYARSLKD